MPRHGGGGATDGAAAHLSERVIRLGLLSHAPRSLHHKVRSLRDRRLPAPRGGHSRPTRGGRSNPSSSAILSEHSIMVIASCASLKTSIPTEAAVRRDSEDCCMAFSRSSQARCPRVIGERLPGSRLESRALLCFQRTSWPTLPPTLRARYTRCHSRGEGPPSIEGEGGEREDSIQRAERGARQSSPF